VSFVDGSLTISAAGLSAIVGSLTGTTSKVYDGNTTATLAPGNFAFTGFASGEGASVTKTSGSYDTANAGTGKTVTVNLSNSDYAATGSTLLSNYTLPTSVSGSIGTITQAPLSVSGLTASSKTYDGQTTASVTTTATSFNGKFGSDDVHGVLLDARLVGVLAILQAAFHVNGTTFAHVFAGDLGQAVIKGDAVPLGVFNRFAGVFVLAATAGGHADVGNSLTGGQVADFGVAAAIADQNDFVNGCHVFLQNVGEIIQTLRANRQRQPQTIETAPFCAGAKACYQARRLLSIMEGCFPPGHCFEFSY
jgi:hypothetical protein